MDPKYIVVGADIIPMPRRENRSGGSTEYELFRIRMMLMDLGNFGMKTTLMGPGRNLSGAEDGLVAHAKQHPVGGVIVARLLQSEADIRPHRLRYPDNKDIPGSGRVVGYSTLYLREEFAGGELHPPQLIRAVSILTELPEGKHRTVQARLKPPGQATLERGANVLAEMYRVSLNMVAAWPLGSEVEFSPMWMKRTAYYILAEELPEENREVATRETLALLGDKFAGHANA